jgi:hypothetical protein
MIDDPPREFSEFIVEILRDNPQHYKTGVFNAIQYVWQRLNSDEFRFRLLGIKYHRVDLDVRNTVWLPRRPHIQDYDAGTFNILHESFVGRPRTEFTTTYYHFESYMANINNQVGQLGRSITSPAMVDNFLTQVQRTDQILETLHFHMQTMHNHLNSLALAVADIQATFEEVRGRPTGSYPYPLRLDWSEVDNFTERVEWPQFEAWLQNLS